MNVFRNLNSSIRLLFPTGSRNYFKRKMHGVFALQIPRLDAGMTQLDRSKFEKTIHIPYLQVPISCINRIVGLKSMKKMLCNKIKTLKPVMNSEDPTKKRLLFNPDAKNDFDDEEAWKAAVLDELQKVVESREGLSFSTLEHVMNYDEWDIRSCLKAILPPGLEFGGYAQVGHIIHLNLREELLPYKFAIAEVLHDKIAYAKTVVNKLNAINNEFRFFEMELLAGIPEYVTVVHEHGLRYELDFSKVFWNSRLTRVHELMLNHFNRNSVVFDIFCGVGPFVIPAVKLKNVRKCFANDLNPLSIDYLRRNVKLNKVESGRIEAFNMDGVNFIRNVMPEKIAEIVREKESLEDGLEKSVNFHSVMNLPCLAVHFLANFKGFLHRYPETRRFYESNTFYVYCHLFVKAQEEHPREWFAEKAEEMCRAELGLPDLHIEANTYIRKVAPNKEMFCVTFQLPADYAYQPVADVPRSAEVAAIPLKRSVDLIRCSNEDEIADNDVFLLEDGKRMRIGD